MSLVKTKAQKTVGPTSECLNWKDSNSRKKSWVHSVFFEDVHKLQTLKFTCKHGIYFSTKRWALITISPCCHLWYHTFMPKWSKKEFKIDCGFALHNHKHITSIWGLALRVFKWQLLLLGLSPLIFQAFSNLFSAFHWCKNRSLVPLSGPFIHN